MLARNEPENTADLDDTVDANAETRWDEVMDRRSREIADGSVRAAR